MRLISQYGMIDVPYEYGSLSVGISKVDEIEHAVIKYRNVSSTNGTKIADTYGYDSQSRQLIEEMAELTQAINKYWRKQLECGKKDFEIKPTFLDCGVLIMPAEYDKLVEELADVQIMISQMVYLLRIDIEQIIEQKLTRQLERIDKNE